MLARPFWNVEQSVRYGDSFVSIPDLLKENEDLRKMLANNEGKYLQAEFLEKENAELKKLLGRGEKGNSILAQILKKPPLSAYDIFILDQGSDNGIRVGNKVYALGSIPIGEIVEVTGRTSKVRLFSSAGEKYTVFIGENNIEATAYGRGGGTFEASVPRDTKITRGNAVTIPELNKNFLGRVEDIISEPSHPFAIVLFNQPLNIYELRWVEVEIRSVTQEN
jgi:cell shape-determining protein MreC